MCAAENGKKTVVIDKNSSLGRKLMATGNGRCNLMNRSEPRYYGDTEYAIRVIRHCGIEKQEQFWHKYGLILKEESQGRVYPATFQSASVVEALRTGLKMNGVEVLLQREVKAVLPDEKGYTIITSEEEIKANRVILATGGLASPGLGGSDSGYRIAEKLGYKTTSVYPALCGIKTDQRSVSGLSGMRVRGKVSVYRHHNELHREKGEILFTSDGISGICVMQCARFVACNGADTAELDLTPDIYQEDNKLIEEIRFRRRQFASESPEFLFIGMIPRKMSYAVCKQAGIPLRGENLGSLNPETVDHAVYRLKHYSMKITGTKGFDAAQVTAGGIPCKSFSADTMESSIHPGLYAAGEILDVDGDCGGFNLMFAFATGIIAGENAGGKGS